MKQLRAVLLLLLAVTAFCWFTPLSARGESADDLINPLSSLITADSIGQLATDSIGQWATTDSIDQWTADSIAAARRDSIVNLATSSFKRLVEMKYASASPDSIYPLAMAVYDRSIVALDQVDKYSDHWYKVKNVLRQLDADLEDGAFYYSSKDDNDKKGLFAQTYLDIQLMEIFKGEVWPRDSSYPAMAYIAASRAYNNKEYERAIEYFNIYFSTGETKQREQVYVFMGQACLNSKKYDLAVTAMAEAVKLYPLNLQLLKIAISACIEGGHGEHMQAFLSRALEIAPDDEALLNIQGKLYEDENEYQKAIEIFFRLDQLTPQKLSVAKHIALCYYNMGVSFFNDAVNEPDEKLSRKKRRQSHNYFTSASQKLEEVIASDPMSIKYIKALGVSYLAINSKTQFDEINRRLITLGDEPLQEVFMPPMMTFNDGNRKNYDHGVGGTTINLGDDIPLYSDFASDYITNGLTSWAKKGEFEKIDAYKARVNDASIREEYNKLNIEAQQVYLEQYAKKLRLSDLKLLPYDATNETFKVESSFGDLYFSVPLKNNEAEMFKSNWGAVNFRNPVYYIDRNKVKLAKITVNTPAGKSYTYNNSEGVRYANTDILIDFDAILADINQKPQGGDMADATQGANESPIVVNRLSDVDTNIPRTNKQSPSTLALVIANENYQHAPKVKSARHDGERFAQYCNETLGIPQSNVTLLKDASYGNMRGAMEHLKNTIKSFGGNADVIVYYAGHGIPDEKSSDALLMPTDAIPTIPATSYQLEEFYAELGQTDANSIMVFLDACFSGSNRDGGAVTKGRAVGYKPRQASPRGNMFVLTAASGNETALPYTEKNHGLFTYYVLKKLQESKGDVTLKQLADYVIKSVSQQSNLINKKPQTPTVSTSGTMVQGWKKKKMRP